MLHNALRMISGKAAKVGIWEPSVLINRGSPNHTISHVAAFALVGSNAGDVLLTAVLRDLFTKLAGGISWKSIHARHTVTKDTSKYINRTDGLIIGGGGLFLRDTNENSIGGWQWAISHTQLKQINVPLCLFAVGYNRFSGGILDTSCVEPNRKIWTK